jgi:hydrogenase maturation factor
VTGWADRSAPLGDAVRCEPEEHCITCGDEGVPMRVTGVDREEGLALCVAADGSRSRVQLDLVSPVEQGEVLLVHAGVALVRLGASA